MADRIQQRRDTKARWEQYNPILLEGEIGYVLDDPNLYKIGDGVKAWNSLPYRGYNGTLVSEAGNAENVAMSQKGATDIAYPDLFVFKNYYLTFGGVATQTTGNYHTTDFLPISRHKQIHATCSVSSGVVCGLCFYDANYKKIYNAPTSDGQTGPIDYIFNPEDIPEGAVFMRCCQDQQTVRGQNTIARIWSGVDMDAMSSGINDIKRGNLIINLSRNGETYTFDEAMTAINSTGVPNIYQILIAGGCISYIDKYTKETLIYQFRGVQAGGTYATKDNWFLVGSYLMSNVPNIASTVDIENNFLDVENFTDGFSGSAGFYDNAGTLIAGPFYHKEFTLGAGDYYIMHNPYADLYSFVTDQDGNTVAIWNLLNSSLDEYRVRKQSSFYDRAFNIQVPAGKTYTFKLSSMTNYFVVARRNNPGQVFLNKLVQGSNTGMALKAMMTSFKDSMVAVEYTIYKNGYYIDKTGSEKTSANAQIITAQLSEYNVIYLLQHKCYLDFFGKIVNKAGKVVKFINNPMPNNNFSFDYIQVPNGEVYTLYLTQWIPQGVNVRSLTYEGLTKIWKIANANANANLILNNWIPKYLGTIIKNSIQETAVPFDKVYNQFYNASKVATSSDLCLRAAVTVPAGIYHITTYLGSDSSICLFADDLNDLTFAIWRGTGTGTTGWTDVIIDTTDFSNTEQVTFLISGVQYGKSVNTDFPDEIRVRKVDLKIASGGGGGDVVQEESYTGDVNVTPIHGQSLSLAIVHAVPPIHTYKDTFGLMFNDYVYQVGATAATLQSINPLYERNQESSAYGTATMIRRLITELQQTELGHKCVYMTAGRDGGAIATMVKGTSYYNSLTAAMQRAASLSPGKVVKFPAVYLIQGESDAVNGVNNYQTYYDTVKQFRADLQSDALAILGQTTPVKLIVYQLATRQNIANTIDIQMAHLNLVLENEDFAMSTPMYILDYKPDKVHIDAINEYILGGYQGIAYKKCVVDKQRALPLYPKLIQKIDTRKLLVRFNVPQPPLAFDNTIVSQIDNNGFKVLNAGGVNIITGTELYMDDGVILTCSEDLSTGQVCYAYFPELVGVSGRTEGSRGNLRDSQGDVYTLPMPDGTMRRMDNYCAIFKLPFS